MQLIIKQKQKFNFVNGGYNYWKPVGHMYNHSTYIINIKYYLNKVILIYKKLGFPSHFPDHCLVVLHFQFLLVVAFVWLKGFPFLPLFQLLSVLLIMIVIIVPLHLPDNCLLVLLFRFLFLDYWWIVVHFLLRFLFVVA